MARNRIIYIIAALLSLVFAISYKEQISAVILSAFLIYPLLAWLTTFILLKLVSADFSQNTLRTEKGTRFEISINVRNRSVLPCVPMELICGLPDEDSGLAAEKTIFVTLPPLGIAGLSMNCQNRYRGRYRFDIRKISVFDPLRIIRITKKGKSEMNAVFVPRRLEIPDIEYFCESEILAVRQQNSADSREDFSHVRDYIPGENVQLVHWKLTAKQDEIMIKQFDGSFDRRALILCGINAGSNERDPLLCTDTVIETAIAFARGFSECGIPASVEFGSTADSFCSVTNQAEFEKFFELMSVIAPNGESFSTEKLMGEEAVLVIVTAALTDDIIALADRAASEEAVIVAYVNLSGKSPEINPENEKFIFMNICGAGQDYLSEAFREAVAED